MGGYAFSSPSLIVPGLAAKNVGLTLAAGKLSVVAADGSAFSATKVGRFVMPSAVTQGKHVELYANGSSVHENYFEDDAGASDIIGEEFGVTTAIAWGNDRPFFLYAVNSDDTSANLVFAISPDPTATASPATTNCGYHGVPATTPSDQNFFFLTSTNVTVTHQQKPCVLIGAIRMRMAVTTDDWTVQTLGNTDGIGAEQLRKTFASRWSFPIGHMGAQSNSHMIANGGTAPAFTTAEYVYQVNQNGRVFVELMFTGDGASDGAGAVNARIALPYKIVSGTLSRFEKVIGFAYGQTTITSNYNMTGFFSENTSYVQIRYLDAAALIQPITNVMFSNGDREVSAQFDYHGFKN